NTRNSFGHYVFPKTIRQGGGKGQDFIKFDMMKYTPRQFAKKQNTLEERERIATLDFDTLWCKLWMLKSVESRKKETFRKSLNLSTFKFFYKESLERYRKGIEKRI
ncbi:MAG: hypothetical protein VX670_11190, partial [Candidatus Latescibacterota bacterium]|nr:hypothetical protein [Candidatus Latescibacterota bacterium]